MNAFKWGVTKKQKSAIKADTLAYTFEQVKQRADDCGRKPDSGCTVAKFEYPVFKNILL